ncbi:MAG: GC-type dockerin domain-anchored protein [Phycisphaerales bacterium]|nr:GC-type dockerin domain-anchored protein [Phycisphaerales bacterium]
MVHQNVFSAVGSALVMLGALCTSANADEVTLQNDDLDNGGTIAICPCFAAGEEAAVWLTSPCDGNIVAIQIFWRSFLGGAPQSLEESIIVYESGNFPNPGPIKDQLDGPVLTDGGLNEYRYKDENQTIPISIPVSEGEEFVVSLKFLNSNFTDQTLPSIVSDSAGCQNGKNTIKVNGSTWSNACSLGVSGDWVIRAVIDCTGEAIGAACLPDGSCMENMTEADTVAMGGAWNGAGSECADVQCLGACYIPATEQCVQFDKATCDIVGGDWNGPGSTDCATPCVADINGDGVLNFFDVSGFLTAFNLMDPSADIDGNLSFNFFDVSAFLSEYSMGCP